MTYWDKEYCRLKTMLEKQGWQSVNNEAIGLREWYSQGVLYANFSKRDKVIHIEFGDENCVFGEVIGD